MGEQNDVAHIHFSDGDEGVPDAVRRGVVVNLPRPHSDGVQKDQTLN